MAICLPLSASVSNIFMKTHETEPQSRKKTGNVVSVHPWHVWHVMYIHKRETTQWTTDFLITESSIRTTPSNTYTGFSHLHFFPRPCRSKNFFSDDLMMMMSFGIRPCDCWTTIFNIFIRNVFRGLQKNSVSRHAKGETHLNRRSYSWKWTKRWVIHDTYCNTLYRL